MKRDCNLIYMFDNEWFCEWITQVCFQNFHVII